MTDLRELYQQIILDHNRRPRNFRKLDDANRSAEGDNPLCGDIISVFARVENGAIADIGFQGSGCAISQASASLMTETVKGKSLEEAEQLFKAFHALVTGGDEGQGEQRKTLGKLVALGGVWRFPARVKCANLPWHTLRAALLGTAKSVSTE